MQYTSTFIGSTVRLLVLALSAFVLVAIGCTGAQAFPEATISTVVSAPAIPSNPAVDTAPAALTTPKQDRTSCIPGREETRVERNAVAPAQALLQNLPGFTGELLPRKLPAGFADMHLAGRIPAAMTHLDLGIVRT